MGIQSLSSNMRKMTAIILFCYLMASRTKVLAEDQNISEGNEKFSTELYNSLVKKMDNFVYSPFSISTVMAMLSSGAREETLYQIEKVFQFPPTYWAQFQKIIPAMRSTKEFTLETANAIFIKDGFDLTEFFKGAMKETFHSEVHSLEFVKSKEAAKTINTWVEKKTRDHIKNLINPSMLDALTRLVLVNAIYFKSEWLTKFGKAKEAKFSIGSSSKVRVPMMKKVDNVFYAKMDKLSSTMIELPYKGDRIVMQVLLPNDKNGLTELENTLKSVNIHNLFEKEKQKRKVVIQLPKFKMETTLTLNDDLKSLGLVDMFSAAADFSDINQNEPLQVSHVIQKAFIEVDEEGTTAAAATAAIIQTRSMQRPPPSFIADHPFIFYLRDKTTDMLLFHGKLTNPLK